MTNRAHSLLLLLGVASIAPSCHRGVGDLALPVESRSTLTIAASPTAPHTTTSTRGQAMFHASPPSHRGGGTFTVTNLNAAAAGASSFIISRSGAGRPNTGRYPIRSAASPDTSFVAVAFRGAIPPGDTVYNYGSLRGDLEITRSTPDRVDGRFEFTAGEYSARWPPSGARGSGTPARIDSAAPRVTVRGTFAATPAGVGPPSPRDASLDDTTSLLLWYARGVVRQDVAGREVLFVLLRRAPSDTAHARRMHELRRAGLKITSVAGNPGPDTLLVQFGPVQVDSVTPRGTFYLLGVQQTYCNRDHSGGQGIHVLHVRCDRRACTQMAGSESGTGLRC